MNQLGGLMSYANMQNPNAYAMNYANKNGVSFQTATSQLRSQFGDPAQGMQDCSIFMSNPIQPTQPVMSFDDMDMSQNVADSNSNSVNFFQRIANFFKGPEGPQNEGDPQPHLSSAQDGPQNIGDPQPHLQNQMNFDTNVFASAQDGPQNIGDPQPHLAYQQSGQENPFGQDPDQYAVQYASQNNITLEQAKAELKQMFGDPAEA